MHITEFNSSYRPDNPIHDTAFHAAYLAPVVAAGGDLVDSFSYWTFSDMFEEAGVPTSLFHGGFGLLTHRQIKKPTYHLYAFMARMGDQVLARGDDHLVTRDTDGRVTVLAWAPVDVTGDPPADRHTAAAVDPGRRARSHVGVRAALVGERGDGQRLDGLVRDGPPAPRPGPASSTSCARRPSPPAATARLPSSAGRVDLDLTLARHEVTLVEITAGGRRDPALVGRATGCSAGREIGGHGERRRRRSAGSATGRSSRAAGADLHLLVVELLLLVTTVPAPGRRSCCSTATPATCRSSRVCALPLGPALSAALYALHHRRPDLTDLRPARAFWRGYRINAVPALRLWVPLLAGSPSSR